MFECELTPGVHRALDMARQWAARCRTEKVEPIHLFLGLIDDPEGRAATLLRRAGLDVESAKEALASSVEADCLAPAPPTCVDFNADCMRILQESRRINGPLAASGALTSDQVLLALLRHDGDLSAALNRHGLALDQLEQQVSPAEWSRPIELDEPLELADISEAMATARILDASGNRAREALRVIEDYCRFVLDDSFLCRELKNLRHDLVEALGDHLARNYLEARETQHDVGVHLTTPQESHRHSQLDVIRANFRRLQEALRSLEEYGKLLSATLGRAFESMRYRSYTIERAVTFGTTARALLEQAKLYVLVTRSQCTASLEWTIQEAAAGGANVFQLREKNLSDREWLALALEVRRWTRAVGALFIVNDRPDIARLVHADGVHLGQDDMPVKEARRILGPRGLIGVSAHNLEQLRQAVLDGASYVGIGPVFPSGTKKFSALAGLDYVERAARETSLPAFALGGINAGNVAEVVKAGATRIAVSEAICKATDPRRAAADLRNAIS
ncbi:MAG: hypothetical protein KatS3mg105_2076 [Gemmatales bacterium]|nr:MAG: hypothetical protein KatS3mg105_2076 [Gemmatales bacterium]